MSSQIDQGTGSQINQRKSKRFVPSRLMERLVPLLLLVLAAALVGTLLLVVLSSIKI